MKTIETPDGKSPSSQEAKKPIPGVDYPCPYIPEGNPDLYDRRDLARWADEGLKWEWEQTHRK